MEKIKVKFCWRIYPKTEAATGDFTVVCYQNIKTGERFTASGYGLPANKLEYILSGEWKTSKYGKEFKVSNFEEDIKLDKEHIVLYLSQGPIKGIGPKTAEAIYLRFGNNTLEILDNNIDLLSEIPGIGKITLGKIKESYLANRTARDTLAFLLPYGISVRRALKFFTIYGDKALEIVEKKPYSLCKISGIGFKTADKIALKVGIPPASPERIEEAIKFTLKETTKLGDTCLSRKKLSEIVIKLLETPEITEKTVSELIDKLWEKGQIILFNGNYYSPEMYNAEDNLAKLIKSKSTEEASCVCKNIEEAIATEEKSLGFKLAPEQKAAVISALSNTVCIITGGPGTGKSAIQKAIVEIFAQQFPSHSILCCAPTGKAARRMTEASGMPACTIHSALGLCVGDDDTVFHAKNKLSQDLIIVDEISMLDTLLANELFSNIAKGSRIVLIGDADQLPSVGAGQVLADIIKSGVLPVTKLTTVYRQAAGSLIAVNAALIRNKKSALEYGDDFSFTSTKEEEESKELILETYKKEIQEYGIDGVCVLTPKRKNATTCLEKMNPLLRDIANPPDEAKKEVSHKDRVFREGDKVIQRKNFENIANGDIGYIKCIYKVSDEPVACIDFGDDRIKYFDEMSLEMVDLAYAITVHQSQGSEYQSCILSLHTNQFMLLTKPLVYTAITRAKKKMTIIGQKKALYMAIGKEGEERVTGLLEHLAPKKRGDSLSRFLED